MPFEKLITIVTGGASGIGRALCEELGRRGATVIVGDINLSGAREVANAVVASGGTAFASYMDVRDGGSVRALVDDTVKRHGRLDLLFNNAGIGVGGELHEARLEQWRAVIEVNLMGVVHGIAAAYPIMVRRGSGHIVNIASLAGLIASPGLAPYAATKGAVVSLTNALRAEGEALGVRASAVCPGFVDTAIYDNALGVTIDKTELVEKVGLRMMPARKAALAILRGVERNRGIIVFPWSARFLWLLTRLSPWLLAPLQRRMTQRLRQLQANADRLTQGLGAIAGDETGSHGMTVDPRKEPPGQ
jgi:NAD(P)-dependent dehydrogenase (short-subunit alcohol dehydrogenase family)